MSKIAFFPTLLVTVLVCLLPAAPAQAAAGRTFVSAAGNDSNPCTITMPCRNLQAAYNAVAANGEVDVLDPGNYGSLTITGPVSIQGHGWAGMSANTGAAITINSPGATDTIAISGVVLDSLGIAGTNGIVFNSGGNLTVTDCVAQNFSFSSSGGNGILMQPTSGAMTFVITNTIVTNNNSGGIVYAPPRFSTATANGIIDRVVATNNFIGIAFQTTNGGGATTGAISNSTVGNSSADGISVQNNGSPSGAALAVSIDNTSSTGNAGSGVLVAVTATAILGRSVITANSSFGLRNLTGPNTVYSYQDNRINGNGTSAADDINGSSPNPYAFK
jgi:hypothetical protein